MKTIRRYFNPGDAGLASSLLEAADIHPLLKDVNCHLLTPGPGTGGIQLQVPDEDVEWALEVLNQSPVAPTTDWEADSQSGGEPGGIPRDESGPEEVQNGQIPVAVFVLAGIALAVLDFATHEWRDSFRHPQAPRIFLKFK